MDGTKFKKDHTYLNLLGLKAIFVLTEKSIAAQSLPVSSFNILGYARSCREGLSESILLAQPCSGKVVTSGPWF